VTTSATTRLSPGSDVDAHIGRRIVQRRRAIGLSREQLCESMGLSFLELEGYEAGRVKIRLGLLHDFADELGVRLEYFFNWSADA
jgi:transcriptional regulator with XRE-family HTH domain